MRFNQRSIILLCSAVAVGFTMFASAAENEQDNVDIEGAMKAGEILPLEEIIHRAKSEVPGRITEIELGHSDGRYLYEVDVMDDSGVKRELKLDAKSAELLSSEVDDDDEDEVAEADSGDEDE